jgi:hypothetical protein
MFKTTLKDGIAGVQFEWRVFLFFKFIAFREAKKKV